MKRLPQWITLPIGVILCLAAATGAAQETMGVGKGVDSQILWATPGPSNFATVASSDVMPHAGVSFSAKFDYYHQPVGAKANGKTYWAVDDAIVTDFLWGFGLIDMLQIGVTLPVTLRQSGNGALVLDNMTSKYDAAELELSSSSLKDLRLNVKGRLVGGDAPVPDQRDFGLAIDLGITLPTGDELDFAGENNVVFFPTAVLDFHRCMFSAAVNLGARIRLESARWLDQEVGHQGVAGLGVTGHLVDRRLLLSAESYGVVELDGFDRLGIEYRGAIGFVPDTAQAITIWLAGGSSFGVGQVFGMPNRRFMLSLTYAPKTGENG